MSNAGMSLLTGFLKEDTERQTTNRERQQKMVDAIKAMQIKGRQEQIDAYAEKQKAYDNIEQLINSGDVATARANLYSMYTDGTTAKKASDLYYNEDKKEEYASRMREMIAKWKSKEAPTWENYQPDAVRYPWAIDQDTFGDFVKKELGLSKNEGVFGAATTNRIKAAQGILETSGGAEPSEEQYTAAAEAFTKPVEGEGKEDKEAMAVSAETGLDGLFEFKKEADENVKVNYTDVVENGVTYRTAVYHNKLTGEVKTQRLLKTKEEDFSISLTTQEKAVAQSYLKGLRGSLKKERDDDEISKVLYNTLGDEEGAEFLTLPFLERFEVYRRSNPTADMSQAMHRAYIDIRQGIKYGALRTEERWGGLADDKPIGWYGFVYMRNPETGQTAGVPFYKVEAAIEAGMEVVRGQ